MGGFLGIVDFGIGGLGTYKCLKLQADIPVLYFADSGHATPYGLTAPAVLQERLDKIFDFLFDEGAQRIVIACNSASAVYPDTKRVSGIIGDGVAMLSRGPWSHVGLIAGRGTIETGAYSSRLASLPIKLQERIAQPLSIHIEEGRLDGEILHKDLKDIMAPLRNCDAVLLACTHYPAISTQITQYVRADCALLDPAQEMARRVLQDREQDFHSGNTGASGDRFFTTGDARTFTKCGNRAFGLDLPIPQTVAIQ